jgi:hypothetical protein
VRRGFLTDIERAQLDSSYDYASYLHTRLILTTNQQPTDAQTAAHKDWKMIVLETSFWQKEATALSLK